MGSESIATDLPEVVCNRHARWVAAYSIIGCQALVNFVDLHFFQQDLMILISEICYAQQCAPEPGMMEPAVCGTSQAHKNRGIYQMSLQDTKLHFNAKI